MIYGSGEILQKPLKILNQDFVPRTHLPTWGNTSLGGRGGVKEGVKLDWHNDNKDNNKNTNKAQISLYFKVSILVDAQLLAVNVSSSIF